LQDIIPDLTLDGAAVVGEFNVAVGLVIFGKPAFHPAQEEKLLQDIACFQVGNVAMGHRDPPGKFGSIIRAKKYTVKEQRYKERLTYRKV